ncbi:MAG: LPXTG cell wall anchor domain-containing protein [Pseudomonadota bacterium]
MTFITLALMTTLCLVLPFTRSFAVIGAVILLYFFPQQTLALLGVLLLGGVAFIYIKRRKHRAY